MAKRLFGATVLILLFAGFTFAFQENKPLQGEIVYVSKEQNFVVVNLGLDNAIKLGSAFSVYRNGKSVGIIRVIQLRKRLSACDIEKVYDGQEIKLKDTVFPAELAKDYGAVMVNPPNTVQLVTVDIYAPVNRIMGEALRILKEKTFFVTSFNLATARINAHREEDLPIEMGIVADATGFFYHEVSYDMAVRRLEPGRNRLYVYLRATFTHESRKDEHQIKKDSKMHLDALAMAQEIKKASEERPR